MRPTHISITGKSKHTFNHEVYHDLISTHRFDSIIRHVEAGSIIQLSKNVERAEDLESLISFIVKFGIPRNDIRVRYPSMEPDEILRSKLGVGLEGSGLSFGPDVAEHDSGLERYFINTQAYKAIQLHQKHLIIGPKGSGKSAILRELAAEFKEHLVITPEHYATDVLDALTRGPINTEMAAYTTTWKYTLLVEIFSRVVQSGTGDTAAITQIRKYLVDHGHLSGNLSLFERFVSYARRITKLRGKVGSAEAEVGVDRAGELEKLFKIDELLALVPALRRVLKRSSFSVLIDELDQSWNNSDTANLFLVSLLTAAIQLRGIDSQLHIVVFLRSEIFDLIKPTIPQLDKLRSDIEVIQWSSRELTNLIVSRAFDSLSIDLEKVRAETAISVLFPSGSSSRVRVPTFEYLLSRTSFRPREVIQFCNLALKVARQMDLQAIHIEAVLRAEEEFSEWKMEYIISENIFIYPHLDFLLERLRSKPRELSIAAIDALLTEIILEVESDEKAPAWMKTGFEPQKLLEMLYSLEVIGIEKPHIRDSSGPIWEKYDFVFSRPKGKPEQSGSFLFHPGLWAALEMV